MLWNRLMVKKQIEILSYSMFLSQAYMQSLNHSMRFPPAAIRTFTRDALYRSLPAVLIAG